MKMAILLNCTVLTIRKPKVVTPLMDARVKGTLHWVSAAEAIDAEFRLYDRLFSVENPLDHGEDGDFTDFINPISWKYSQIAIGTSLADVQPGDRFNLSG